LTTPPRSVAETDAYSADEGRAVVEYFHDLEHYGGERARRVNVALVGDGGVGKTTTLYRSFLGEIPLHPDIKGWSDEDVKRWAEMRLQQWPILIDVLVNQLRAVGNNLLLENREELYQDVRDKFDDVGTFNELWPHLKAELDKLYNDAEAARQKGQDVYVKTNAIHVKSIKLDCLEEKKGEREEEKSVGGWLQRKGRLLGWWKRRYFRIEGTDFVCYYKTV
jgi:hypothetical protein